MNAFVDTDSAVRSGIMRAYPATLDTLDVVQQRLTGADRTWPGAATLVRSLVTLPTHSYVHVEQLVSLLRNGLK
jgi:hypothetical protein